MTNKKNKGYTYLKKEVIKTLIRDMQENGSRDIIESEKTVFDYLSVLERLYVIENQEAYTENYRSKERVGKTAKKTFY